MKTKTLLLSLLSVAFLSKGQNQNCYDEPQYQNYTRGSATATYTTGDIPSDKQTYYSTCPGLLSVEIPPYAIITGVDAQYAMTTFYPATMSQQRSRIKCTNSNGGQTDLISGVGWDNGTRNYSYSNLTIANNVFGGGMINFELHALRTTQSAGNDCHTTSTRVDNNTFTVTVHYIMPPIKDIGITSIISPTGHFHNGPRDVVVNLKNFGLDTLYQTTINYQIDGVLGSYQWEGFLAYRSTINLTLTTFDFQNPQLINIKAWTSLPNDENTGNDTASRNVTVHLPFSVPFYEGFDSSLYFPPCWDNKYVNIYSNVWKINSSSYSSPSHSVRATGPTGSAVDLWLFTPKIQLEVGKTYRISFMYRAGNPTYWQNLRVRMGLDAEISSMTQHLFYHNFNHDTFQPGQSNFTVPANGEYIFGFWAQFGQWNGTYGTYLDDILIEEIPQYTTTVIVSPTEAGLVNGQTTFVSSNIAGTNLTLTAVANSGYRFIDWKLGDEILGTNTTLNYIVPDSNSTIQATFEIIQYYPVSFQSVFILGVSEGTLTASINGQTIGNGYSQEEGSNILFTATPATGYRIHRWIINSEYWVDENQQYVTNVSYLHQNLQTYLEVQVEFELIPPTLYTVIFSVQGQNGLLTAVSGNDFVVSGNQLTEGSSVIFTATPNSGYQVRQWTLNNLVINTPDNEIFTEPTFVLTNLEQDVVVTVEFEPIPPTLYAVFFSVQGQNGTLTAVSDNDFVVSGNQLTEGSSVMFTATPNTGYQVRQWTLNNLVVNTPDNEIFTEPIFVLTNLEQDVVVSVEFEQIPISQAVVSFAVELGSGTLVAEFDNNQIDSGAGVPPFSEVLFLAIPDSGWKVKRWLVNDYEVLNTDSSIYVLDTLVVDVQQQNIFVVVEFETLVSVFEMQRKTVVYPNPCNSELYIENHNDVESLTLYNLKGESVLQVSRPAQGFINVESMHSGAYILKIEYKDNSHESLKIWKY